VLGAALVGAHEGEGRSQLISCGASSLLPSTMRTSIFMRSLSSSNSRMRSLNLRKGLLMIRRSLLALISSFEVVVGGAGVQELGHQRVSLLVLRGSPVFRNCSQAVRLRQAGCGWAGGAGSEARAVWGNPEPPRTGTSRRMSPTSLMGASRRAQAQPADGRHHHVVARERARAFGCAVDRWRRWGGQKDWGGPACLSTALAVGRETILASSTTRRSETGHITRWNDARVAAANPGVGLG
jgi:hypothetical protein